MGQFRRLDDGDRRAAIELLSGDPGYTMMMLYNVESFGLEPGAAFAHADYFGHWDGDRLVAIAGLYELGTMLLYAEQDDAFRGCADFLLQFGRRPAFVHGRRELVSSLIDEIDGRLGTVVGTYPVQLMVLQGAVLPGIDSSGARAARQEDLEPMVDMSMRLEEELFDGITVARAVARELLSRHIEDGTAVVVERDGVLVAKAEGRIAGRFGARVGGVYTRPEHRDSGHAIVCVAELCRLLLQRVPLVTLDAHANNERALAIYHRIGFRKAGDDLIVTIAP